MPEPKQPVEIDAIKAAVSLSAVIGAAVSLKRVGKHWKGCCPFHNDRTPSFYVYDDSYHCFGCGEHGDVFDWFKKRHGMSINEAARHLSGGGAMPPAAAAAEKTPPPPAWAPLVPVPAHAPPPPSGHFVYGAPVHVARYLLADGSLAGIIHRYEPPGEKKQVLPLTYCQNGARREWRWQGLPKPRPLYGTETLSGAARVLVVEGEMKCEAARRLLGDAMAVVSWPGGTNAVQGADWSPLAGRDVAIWPDADEVGIAAARAVFAELRRHNATARIIDPPDGAPQGWDLADAETEGWSGRDVLARINAPAKRTQPLALIDHAPPDDWPDVPPPEGEADYGQVSERNNGEPVIEVFPPEFADDALALNFSETYSAGLRYVDAWARWYRWDGSAWCHDDTLMVYDLVRRTCRSYAVNASPTVQKAITSGKTIAAVEKLARSDRRHAATVNQWDADPWLLNTPGGVIDLRSGIMLAHDPAYHMTKRTSVSPDKESGCPLWLRFLDEATAGDAALQAYLQRVCGYALTGVTREHAMFFAYGTGRNGKGVFLNTVVRVLGDYAMTADPDTFTASGTGKHLTVLARLQGARLVVAQETEEGIPWAESRIKSITGGDPITANYMRQDHFTYLPQFKLFMAGNHKPGLRSVDEAIKARFNLVPFTVTVPKEKRDEQLTEKLAAEAPGILQWMIEGCLDWQQIKLKPPKVVSEATGEYFDSEDAFGLWIEACCIVKNGVQENSGNLFRSWSQWAQGAGEPVGSQKRFSQIMASRGLTTKKGGQGVRYILGIRLLPQSGFQGQENEYDE